MKENLYIADFEGNEIKFTSRDSLLQREIIEKLYINGKLIGENTDSMFRMFSSVSFEVELGGVEREIEFRIAVKSYSFRNGFQILVDGELIKGDLNIKYPEPKIMSAKIEKGFLRFFLINGILMFGLPLSIVLTMMNLPETPTKILVKIIYFAFFMGLTVSGMQWQSMKKVFGKKSKL